MEHYLDNCATTMVCDEIVDTLCDVYKNKFGNPSSLHKKGIEAEMLITKSAKNIANIFSVNPDEIYFTSGGTEGNNLCIFGAVDAKKREGNRIVSTAFEHSSVAKTMDKLEAMGFDVVRIKPNRAGEIDIDEIISAVDDKTILVSTMLVNNEIGTVLPITDIAKRVKQKNKKILFHTDCVQGFLKIPIKIKNSDVDMLTISGHKVHAPKGIGAVYIKKGTKVTPQIIGGMQQKGIRSGTENVPGIVALGKSAEIFCDTSKNYDKVNELNQYLRERLEGIKEVKINSPKGASPYILNFSVLGIRSEIMLHFLENLGIFVSSGSACSKGGASATLTAMGLPKAEIDSAIRTSFSVYSTKDDIDALVNGILDGIKNIRKSR
ncbi:MAG: cysteine desulfurase [Oscillospiraceae bacterium]|nr:cysteine desulfurase [Oscillospiraceae bacterium]